MMQPHVAEYHRGSRPVDRRVTLLMLAAAWALTACAAGTSRQMPDFADDPFTSIYRAKPGVDTVIVGAVVLDGAGGRIDDGEVLIRDGRIVEVGRDLDRSGATTIDARGRWVTPGLIDVHSHNGTYSLPQTTIDSKASDISEVSDPNVADTWIEHAVNAQDPSFSAALAGGVTTLQVVPGSIPLIGGRTVVLKPVPAAEVLSMKFPGAPQGLKMACGENPKYYFSEKGRAPNSRQGEIALLRAAFTRAREYRDSWMRYVEGAGKEPPARDLKLDTLVAVLDGKIPVHVHCYRASDMAAMLAVAREFDFRISVFHHATEAYKIADQLREAGTCVATWSDWWGFKMEALDAIRDNAALVESAGGCVMMHSDSPLVGQRLNIEAAKAAAAWRRTGSKFPEEIVIRWVTSVPATALGLGDRIGTLAPGLNADLIVWSGNPLSVYSKPDLVFIDGAVVHDRGADSPARRPDFAIGRPAEADVR